jgi:hypothetical protein
MQPSAAAVADDRSHAGASLSPSAATATRASRPCIGAVVEQGAPIVASPIKIEVEDLNPLWSRPQRKNPSFHLIDMCAAVPSCYTAVSAGSQGVVVRTGRLAHHRLVAYLPISHAANCVLHNPWR